MAVLGYHTAAAHLQLFRWEILIKVLIYGSPQCSNYNTLEPAMAIMVMANIALCFPNPFFQSPLFTHFGFLGTKLCHPSILGFRINRRLTGGLAGSGGGMDRWPWPYTLNIQKLLWLQSRSSIGWNIDRYHRFILFNFFQLIRFWCSLILFSINAYSSVIR